MSRKGAPSQRLEEMLRQAQVVQQQMPRTVHKETIIFQGCQLGWYLVADDTNTKVDGYQVQIEDPQENKTYIFQFGQEVMTGLNQWVNTMPNVGEPLPAPADGN